MQIKKVLLNTLKPLSANVRYHPEPQIKELARSLSQFGQVRALVIDEDNNILIGNGMYSAMLLLGWTEGSAYQVEGMNEIQKKKLILSDNKTYELGKDDFNNIELYLKEIASVGDYDIAGFDPEGIKLILIDNEQGVEQGNSYGVMTEDASNQMDKIQTRMDNTIPTPTPTPIPQPQTQNSERKTVVCTKCGEVIYLD